MHARQMRVSDAERERVAAFLREQTLEGRLDHEELEERLGAAYAAKTVGQLQDLIEDLPRQRVPVATAARPMRRQHRGPHLLPLLAFVVLALFVVPAFAATGGALAVAVIAAIFFSMFALGIVIGPFVVIGMIVASIFRRSQRPPHRGGWNTRPF